MFPACEVLIKYFSQALCIDNMTKVKVWKAFCLAKEKDLNIISAQHKTGSLGLQVNAKYSCCK